MRDYALLRVLGDCGLRSAGLRVTCADGAEAPATTGLFVQGKGAREPASARRLPSGAPFARWISAKNERGATREPLPCMFVPDVQQIAALEAGRAALTGPPVRRHPPADGRAQAGGLGRRPGPMLRVRVRSRTVSASNRALADVLKPFVWGRSPYASPADPEFPRHCR